MATAVLTTNGQDFDVARYKNKYKNRVIITMSTSYTTGGEALSPSQCGMTTINSVMIGSPDGYTFEYDPTTGKVKAYTAPATEVVATTNLSGIPDIIAEVWGD